MHCVDYINDIEVIAAPVAWADFNGEVSKGLFLPILEINSCLEPDKIYKKSHIDTIV
jgi:hypothetical protein